MYKKIIITFHVILILITCFGKVKALDREIIKKNKFSGHWKGEGKIIVAWCEQKQLSFELQIDMNGNVSGKIGDAHIRHGKIRLNNIIYRWLGNKEYIIDAELSDYLIEKQKIKRESIRIFFDFRKPFFIGGFHTSGSKFGGKEKMILSGTDIKLSKITMKNAE